jgi:Calx-beta domain/Domain of unknown function (DUF4214)
MKQLFSKIPALFVAAMFLTMFSSPALGQATIVIQNNDPAGVGFNDTTAASPVGGNTGTTIGQQRLNAFQYAASIWGATLPPGPTITITASWPSTLSCTASSGVLGSAGAVTRHRDFVNGIRPSTWYSVALANALAGADLNGSQAEIQARFNVRLGTPGCLENAHWYYGLNANQGAGEINLSTVLLHEFAHGLGFQTFTNADNGAQSNGFPSIYDFFLRDNTTGKIWTEMTDSERAASARNTGNLVWNGPQVLSDAAAVLTNGGKDSQGRPQMFAPGTFDSGSSVSHWSTAASPNQLMEPNISFNLTHSVKPPQDLTFSLLTDIGWCVANCPPPPPAPTPTPTPAVPANNNFTNPQVIAGCNGSVSGTNIGANKEVGEPSHSPDGDAGLGSVWYQWTAPASSSVTITTAGSNYDTLLAVYTGTAFNNLNVIGKNDDVSLGSVTTSTLTFNATAGTVYRIAVDGWGGDLGNITLNWAQTSCSKLPEFSASSFSVGETAGSSQIIITRTNTAGAATVDYSTSDGAGLNECTVVNGTGSSRCDYATSIGTLRFAAGESSKPIFIPIIDDSYAEGNETFTLTLSNPTGTALGTPVSATITIVDNETVNGLNPIDGVDFFIRQQYIDFLGREPDPAGLAGWRNVLNNCGTTVPPPCDRIEVSAGFFRSEEFQSRGYFVYRFYSAVGRIPLSNDFFPDFAKLSGFLTADQLEANKVAYVNEFMARTEFQNKYAATFGNPTGYVDALLQTVGLPNHPSRSSWIGLLNGGNTAQNRATVLRQLVESSEVYNKYYNEAFVIMQYFGYLRRTADASYLSWIQTMNSTNGDYRIMINGFMNSAEYRRRFGP